MADEGGLASYVMHDPPLSLISEGNIGTFSFEGGSDGQPRMVLHIAANPTGPEREYIFDPVS